MRFRMKRCVSRIFEGKESIKRRWSKTPPS
jgi:hypothetical protein